MNNIAPCKYPGCKSVDGNPEMTREVICESCRRRYHRLVFEWLPQDYLELIPLPSPVSSGSKVRSSSREYGHPAEWASDKLAEIAHALHGVHSWLAGYRGDPQPGPRTIAERRRIREALAYLDGRFDALCTFPDSERACGILVSIHNSIRIGLGHGRRVSYVGGPCPDCHMPRLYRVSAVDNESVDCRECGLSMSWARYNLWAELLVNEALDG